MVPVASLLNPMPSSSERFGDYSSPTLKDPKPSSPSLARPKKQKMSKAAATFVKGKPKGEVNYTPYEIQDEATAREHIKFEVQPIGRIGEYPKRIPYNSEKKTFQQKTGMDGFEGMCRYPKQAVWNRSLPSVLSLSVHLQNARRSSRQGCTHRDVGLQRGFSEDHGILQESEAHKGMQFPGCPCKSPGLHSHQDNAGKSDERKSRPP